MTITRLQRTVVDALEDIKAQDIQVFNTMSLSDLFDRVIVASATSNRQTRALAAHVREKAKEDGFECISVEGEDSGEWVLVDLGDVIVHIMQPAIRSYYNIEELWGAKPVRMKLNGVLPGGAGRPAAPRSKAGSAGAGGTLGADPRSTRVFADPESTLKAPVLKTVRKSTTNAGVKTGTKIPGDRGRDVPRIPEAKRPSTRLTPQGPVRGTAGKTPVRAAHTTGTATPTPAATKPGTRTASKTAIRPGTKTAARTGAKTASKTASKTGARTATKTAARTGSAAPKPRRTRTS